MTVQNPLAILLLDPFTERPAVPISIHSQPSAHATTQACAECARVNNCQPCFEELVRRFQTPLLQFLIRRLGSRHEAEDILQETFLTAYRSLYQYKSKWLFSTWIFTIANRRAISQTRKRHVQTISFTQTVGETCPANPLTIAGDNEARGKLWDAAQQILEPDSFTAIWLSYVESMPAAEIGQVLNRNANAVRILLHRARAQLAKRLDSPWEDTGVRL